MWIKSYGNLEKKSFLILENYRTKEEANMFHLITGGSGSGKSEYAENAIVQYHKSGKPLYYIATMEPFGEETKRKIERHRKMRAGKGFQTIECYMNLHEKVQDAPFAGGSVLLECMSNLTANEVYRNLSNYPSEEALVEAIFQGVKTLTQICENVVVVTNEVCSECAEDTVEMQCYKRVLSGINCKMAITADKVTEVVYGIPVVIKEEMSCK